MKEFISKHLETIICSVFGLVCIIVAILAYQKFMV